MKKMFSGFAQLILGFAIAILLVVGGSVAASLYLVARLTALPPKPDFSAHSSTAAIATPTESPSPTPTPAAKPAATSTPTPTPTPTPSGLYQAKVVWPDGLVIRAEASYEAASVGGVAFDAQVTVLEEKDAGAWQRIRSSTGEEGWVVGGNLATIDATE
jgi:hypothetical protein